MQSFGRCACFSRKLTIALAVLGLLSPGITKVSRPRIGSQLARSFSMVPLWSKKGKASCLRDTEKNNNKEGAAIRRQLRFRCWRRGKDNRASPREMVSSPAMERKASDLSVGAHRRSRPLKKTEMSLCMENFSSSIWRRSKLRRTPISRDCNSMNAGVKGGSMRYGSSIGTRDNLRCLMGEWVMTLKKWPSTENLSYHAMVSM